MEPTLTAEAATAALHIIKRNLDNMSDPVKFLKWLDAFLFTCIGEVPDPLRHLREAGL